MVLGSYTDRSSERPGIKKKKNACSVLELLKTWGGGLQLSIWKRSVSKCMWAVITPHEREAQETFKQRSGAAGGKAWWLSRWHVRRDRPGPAPQKDVESQPVTERAALWRSRIIGAVTPRKELGHERRGADPKRGVTCRLSRERSPFANPWPFALTGWQSLLYRWLFQSQVNPKARSFQVRGAD